MRRDHHLVQLYERDEAATGAAAEFLRLGLARGEGAIVLATPARWAALQRELGAVASGPRVAFVPAADVLRLVRVDGRVEREPFEALLADLAARVGDGAAGLRCCSEVAGLLAAAGRPEAALALEGHWHDFLARQPSASLLCGYASSHVGAADGPWARRIAAAHAHAFHACAGDAAKTPPEAAARLGALELRSALLELETRALATLETELDATQRALAATGRLAVLGEICAGIAHEFNNPLAIIQGSVDRARVALARDAALASATREDFERRFRAIESAGQRMAGVVRGIVTFSGKATTARRPFSLTRTIEAAVAAAQASLAAAHVAVALELGTRDLVLEGDEGLMAQAFGHLVANATEAIVGRAGAGGGTLEIQAHEDQAGVVVTVADDGCGMEAATLERVFHPFFTTKRPGQGTGLGLAITRGIVMAHGGRITCASVAGQGTVFLLSLPRATAVTAA
jgi:signal transduction histidine kinase